MRGFTFLASCVLLNSCGIRRILPSPCCMLLCYFQMKFISPLPLQPIVLILKYDMFSSRYMHRWELDAALDVLTMCSCHLPENDAVRNEVLVIQKILFFSSP